MNCAFIYVILMMLCSHANSYNSLNLKIHLLQSGGAKLHIKSLGKWNIKRKLYSTGNIISPFDNSRLEEAALGNSEETSEKVTDEDPLPLTRENVELVLDTLRPFLQADGGDVTVVEISGNVVILQLQGACGTCPSSAMTMKNGLEKTLLQRIPTITEIVQRAPEAPAFTEDNLENILAGVRPFLAVAGGTIRVVSISTVGGLQPSVVLELLGTAAALQSVKDEIQQRIQKHFAAPVKVQWV